MSTHLTPKIKHNDTITKIKKNAMVELLHIKNNIVISKDSFIITDHYEENVLKF